MNCTRKAYGLLVLTFFLWGSVYVAGKLVSDEIPAVLLACLRCVAAMVPLGLMARRHAGVRIEPEDRKWFLLVGFTGYFLTILMIQVGIALTGASMAALINSLTPVMVTVLAAVLLKERITPVKVICLLLALTGAAVITRGVSSHGQVLGITAVLTAVVSFAAASVYLRKLTAKYPAVLVTTYSMAVSLLFHIPAGIFTAVTQPVVITPLGVAVVLYLGFAGSGAAQYTWTKCLSLLPASTCSLFYPLQPMFTAVLGAWILGETFTMSFFAGLLLISLDIVLSTIETQKSIKMYGGKKE